MILLIAGLGGLHALIARPHPPRAPATRDVELIAAAVPTLAGVVRSSRRGRTLEVLAPAGSAVSRGDPLVAFEDLALRQSRADLRSEIESLRDQAPARSDAVREASLEVRIAALRQLEESYDRERRELERLRNLHDQGLLARRDYERAEAAFKALGQRLEDARKESARSAPQPAANPPAIRRSQALLGRLAKLPDAFAVKSPWDGAVTAIHVREGEIPDRRAPLATIARAALPRLEARLESPMRIDSLRSACGQPGPFPFTLDEGVVSLAAPLPGIRPGDSCTLVAAAIR